MGRIARQPPGTGKTVDVSYLIREALDDLIAREYGQIDAAKSMVAPNIYLAKSGLDSDARRAARRDARDILNEAIGMRSAAGGLIRSMLEEMRRDDQEARAALDGRISALEAAIGDLPNRVAKTVQLKTNNLDAIAEHLTSIVHSLRMQVQNLGHATGQPPEHLPAALPANPPAAPSDIKSPSSPGSIADGPVGKPAPLSAPAPRRSPHPADPFNWTQAWESIVRPSVIALDVPEAMKSPLLSSQPEASQLYGVIRAATPKESAGLFATTLGALRQKKPHEVEAWPLHRMERQAPKEQDLALWLVRTEKELFYCADRSFRREVDLLQDLIDTSQSISFRYDETTEKWRARMPDGSYWAFDAKAPIA